MRPAEVKPIAGINSGSMIVPADAARPTAQPPQAAPRKPDAAAQPAPAWPAEVKPIPGGRIIVPTAGARPSDNPVARRWLDNSGKPAPDQEPDKKTND